MRSECREAFERNECDKYGNSYDDMKKYWDWYESQYGWRYPEDSPRGLEWKAWEKAWNHRQTEVDQLLKNNDDLANGQCSLYKRHVELQKRMNEIIQQSKDFIRSCKNDAEIFEDTNAAGKAYGAEAVVELLEQALKGDEP